MMNDGNTMLCRCFNLHIHLYTPYTLNNHLHNTLSTIKIDEAKEISILGQKKQTFNRYHYYYFNFIHCTVILITSYIVLVIY